MNSLAKLVTVFPPGFKNQRGRLYNASVSPPQIPGLILWLRADTLGLADGVGVSAWPDSSFMQANAVQASGTLQPLFKTSIQNGKPVVRFDGSNDYLSISGFAKGIFTAFYVYKATTGGILVEHSVNAGTNTGDYHYIPGAAHFLAKAAGGTSAFDITPALTTGVWRILSRSMDGTNAGHLAYVNGVLATRASTSSSGDPGNGTTTATFYIGGRAGSSLFTAGDYAEIIYYNAVLSSQNRKVIEAYLSNKWGIAVTP